MMSLVLGRGLRPSLVASIPSRFGSSTSMISTSGSSSLTTSTTSRPLPASPTMSSTWELAIRALIASLTISWSSQRTTRFASRTLVLMFWRPSPFLRRGANPLRRAKGMQNIGYGEPSVPLLTVLDQGDHGPAHGYGGPVQRVKHLWRFAVAGPIPTTEATGLVVGRVRAGGQLAVALLARDPRLAVELAGGGGSEVADRDVDDPIRDLEVGEGRLRHRGE